MKNASLLLAAVAAGAMFFCCSTAGNGAQQPELTGDINTQSAGGSPQAIAAVGTVSYFVQSDRDHGEELWKSDGTAAGTAMVKDIVAGSGSSAPYSLANIRGTLYFGTNTAAGWELWQSDGTARPRSWICGRAPIPARLITLSLPAETCSLPPRTTGTAWNCG